MRVMNTTDLLLLDGRNLALDAVARATLLATFDSEAIERATHNVVTHTGEISHTAAAHEHNGMLLKIVAFASDVCRDFTTI